jgi:hypothetical protein
MIGPTIGDAVPPLPPQAARTSVEVATVKNLAMAFLLFLSMAITLVFSW